MNQASSLAVLRTEAQVKKKVSTEKLTMQVPRTRWKKVLNIMIVKWGGKQPSFWFKVIPGATSEKDWLPTNYNQ